MTIKHLVLSGGGAAGFTIYGILKELSNKEYIDFKNSIKSIHAISAGCIICVLLLLTNNWEELDNYMIKRPWDKLFNIEPEKLLNLWNKKGIHDTKLFCEIYKPFFKLKDMDENTTLLELFNLTGVEINMYSTVVENNSLEKLILSYKTYPNLEVYKAVAMSSAFPILFEPIFYDNKCIIDGGILNNFPLEDCLKNVENELEILGINLISEDSSLENLSENTSFPKYLYHLVSNMHKIICNYYDKSLITNIIYSELTNNGIGRWIECGNNENIRIEYINQGTKIADDYLKSKDL